MASIDIDDVGVGTALNNLLTAADIEPGTTPSYEVCKTIYLFHPLGKKIADKPINEAMAQPRKITIANAPGDKLAAAFEAEWKNLEADRHIYNAKSLSRVYGIASIIVGTVGEDSAQPLSYDNLIKQDIYFNVLDPLNTAGSLVLSQRPNAPDFMKHGAIAVSGQPYDLSRSVTIMNENPVYISYTSSAFGFVGRSVYQRALYPLKSYVQTMITNDLISLKAGVLVSKTKDSVSIADRLRGLALKAKREMIKMARTFGVINIGIEDSIEALDLQNIDKAGKFARDNILMDIACAADMPAKMLNEETFAEGFGEGTEDAKKIATYVSGIRKSMQPLYDFFDPICMRRAWTEDFYATMQSEYPDRYAGVPYATAFVEWTNNFKAEWGSLLIEPESEQVKTKDVKLKAVISVLEVMLPVLDPYNKGKLVEWAQLAISDDKVMFASPLELDIQAFMDYEPPAPVAVTGGESVPEKL